MRGEVSSSTGSRTRLHTTRVSISMNLYQRNITNLAQDRYLEFIPPTEGWGEMGPFDGDKRRFIALGGSWAITGVEQDNSTDSIIFTIRQENFMDAVPDDPPARRETAAIRARNGEDGASGSSTQEAMRRAAEVFRSAGASSEGLADALRQLGQSRAPAPPVTATPQSIQERFFKVLSLSCADAFTATMDVCIAGQPTTAELTVQDEGKSLTLKVGDHYIDILTSSLIGILLDPPKTKSLELDRNIPLKRNRRALGD